MSDSCLTGSLRIQYSLSTASFGLSGVEVVHRPNRFPVVAAKKHLQTPSTSLNWTFLSLCRLAHGGKMVLSWRSQQSGVLDICNSLTARHQLLQQLQLVFAWCVRVAKMIRFPLAFRILSFKSAASDLDVS